MMNMTRKSKQSMTESTQLTNQRKTKQPAPPPQQDDHNARQDPLNTTLRHDNKQYK